MTLEELRERIKNELVLHEGNVADWQWNRTGLPAEATELGVADFLRLVDDVSRPLNAQFGKILELQAVIRKVAVDTQKRLSEVQIGGFALDAERLGLSRPFVSEQWVPRILNQIPDAPVMEVAKPSTPPSGPGTLVVPTSADLAEASGTLPTPPVVSSAGPSSGASLETAETMQRKVRDILDDYKEHVPAPAIRALFKAINYDEKALADAVLAYLTANFYASEKEPQGATLREKLVSTDWRHLVWWDRSTQAPTAPVPSAPAQASQPVAQGTSPVVATPPSTGWRDFLVALLIAGGLIGFVVVLVKSNGSSAQEERTQTEQDNSRRTAEQAEEAPGKLKRKRKASTKSTQEADRKKAADAAVAKPTSPRNEPYDELLDDVGQYGDRRARKAGQWGLWRKGKWMVLPVYDEIEVYKEGRAHVTVNGNSYDIDRNGDRIRE